MAKGPAITVNLTGMGFASAAAPLFGALKLRRRRARLWR